MSGGEEKRVNHPVDLRAQTQSAADPDENRGKEANNYAARWSIGSRVGVFSPLACHTHTHPKSFEARTHPPTLLLIQRWTARWAVKTVCSQIWPGGESVSQG